MARRRGMEQQSKQPQDEPVAHANHWHRERKMKNGHREGEDDPRQGSVKGVEPESEKDELFPRATEETCDHRLVLLPVQDGREAPMPQCRRLNEAHRARGGHAG